MDDSMQDCNNNKEHKDYSSAVKNMVSNRVFTMEAKGKDTEQVAWNGRILGCFNDDSSSISAMPNLTTSFQDKVIVLKPEGNKDLFKDGNAELMRKELPAFATYLYHHEIPIEIRDDRFGTVAYINTAILEKLRMTTSRDGLEETLKAFLLTLYASGHGDLQDGYYSTSVNKLYSNMTTDFGMKSQMGHASLPTFYRFMGKVKDDRVQFPWAENPTRSIWKFDCRYLHDLYSPEEIKAMIHYDPEINPRNL
jgi:hypothetical protein